jgi:hypothetical protein
MILAKINLGPTPTVSDWRILPGGAGPRWEKNWMPQVAGDDLRFVYSIDPERVLRDDGSVVHDLPSPFAAATFFGGSQLIPFDDGWISIVHESEWVNRTRRYFHRFIYFDRDSRVRSFSRRFFMIEPGYEFVAGLAWSPGANALICSFSRDDRDPYLAFIDATEVRASLKQYPEHEAAAEAAIGESLLPYRELRHEIGPST